MTKTARIAWTSALLLLLAALLQAARAQDAETEAYRAPRPGWVADLEIPAPDEARLAAVDEGVYYLLYDTQTRLGAEGYELFHRTARKVVSRAGLEGAAQISYGYDPSREDLKLHAVRLWRDGVATDVLPELRLDTARQEPLLGQGVTDGEITVFAEVPGVRVGDVIDVEASWRTRDPLWPDGYAAAASTRWSIPVGVTRFRLLAPADRRIEVRVVGEEIEPEVAVLGDEIERTWTIANADPVLGESDTPFHHPTWGYVTVSTMQSWAEVAAWATATFDVDTTLPPAVMDEIARIRNGGAGPGRQITLALRYVQDTIRYVGDEAGLGSHVPRSPSFVVENGYGDCKDKSLLLTLMLRELGFEAYPALTDVDAGRGLPDQLPSPYAFDHAIVQVLYDGESYWLDPTRTHQGGLFPRIAQPLFAYALPIRDGQAALEEIAHREPSAPQIEVAETFDLEAAKTDGVELVVRTRYTGREADGFRLRLDLEGRRSIAAQFLSYYQSLYPGLEADGELLVSDTLNTNVIEVEERYRLSPESFQRNQLHRAFPLRADAISGLAPAWNGAERRTPIALPHPIVRRHVIELRNAGMPLTGRGDVAIEDSHLRFRVDSVDGKDGMRMELELTTLAPEVPAAEVEAYARVIDALGTYGSSEIDLEPLTGPLAWLGRATAGWTDEQFTLAGMALLFTVYGLATVIGLWVGLASDAKRPVDAVFYPVGVAKFVILSAATFGIYTFLWMWRCWKWVKKDQPRPMWPLARAFFNVIFYYPLFDEVRRRAGGSSSLTLVGVFLAVLYAAASVAETMADRLERVGISMAIGVGSIALLLPIVWGVNRLNRDNEAARRRGSRWGVGTFAALLVGASAWALVGLGLWAPVTVGEVVTIPPGQDVDVTVTIEE